MENMTFRNNSLGFAQPTWTTLNNALDCRLGTDVESRWGMSCLRTLRSTT